MNDLTVILILIAGAYIGWKILVAAIKGLGIAGRTIKNDGPDFLSKVFVSIASGVIGGVIVSLSIGQDLSFMGPTGAGIAAVAFLAQSFTNS